MESQSRLISHTQNFEGQIGTSKFSKMVPKLDVHRIQKTMSKGGTKCGELGEEKNLLYRTKKSIPSMSPSVQQ